MNTTKTTASTFLIALLVALPTAASSHCPNGGECFTVDKAEQRIDEECSEIRQRWESCKSELTECNEVDTEKQKLAGALEECRHSNKQLEQTIRHEDKTVERLEGRLESSHTTWELVGWTVGGVTFGVPIGIVIAKSL